MKRTNNNTPTALWNVVCTLLFVCIMSNMWQGIVESRASELAMPDSSNHASGATFIDHGEIIHSEGEFQLAKVYMAPIPHSKEGQKERKQNLSAQTERRVQVLLMGGLLLTIGTIFIPLLLPQLQMQKDQGRFSHAVGKTYKSILRRYLPFSLPFLGSDNMAIPRNLPPRKNADRLTHEYRVVTDYRLHDNRASLTSRDLCSPTVPVVKTTEAFFQQSGFQLIEHSQTCLLVTSTQSQYKRYGKIPVFLMKDQIIPDNIAIQAIYRLIHARQPNINGKIACVIVEEPLHTSAYQQIYEYRSRDNMVIIPINQKLMAKSVRQSTCAQTLEKIVAIALGKSNLYEQTSPIANPFNFFGRCEILYRLIDAVSHLQHIGLFGLRKIGKTSFIWQLKEYLAHHVVAYVDLQHLPQNRHYLYRIIIEECVRDASCKYPHVTLPELCTLCSEDTEIHNLNFIRDLIKIWECLKSYRHDLKIILLLDEVEHLVPKTTEHTGGFAGFHEFIGTLREISQHYEFLVSVMISSSPEISRIDTWKGQNNPGFQYYKEIFLSSLSEEGCNQMICDIGAQMGLLYTEESLSRIYYETGGHPYVTRQLCSLIAQNLRSRTSVPWSPDSTNVPINTTTVKVQDIENAVSAYIEYKRDYLESVWQRLSHTARELLFIITTNGSCTLEELMTSEQDYDAKRERRKAIATLVENKIIEKCEQKYSITMGLFERFILTSN